MSGIPPVGTDEIASRRGELAPSAFQLARVAAVAHVSSVRATGLRQWSAPLYLLGATLLFVAALVLWARRPSSAVTPVAPASSTAAPAPTWSAEAIVLRPPASLAADAGASIAGNDATKRIDAAFRLGASNDPAALHPLCECLSDDTEAEPLRLACASALARLRRAGTVACLNKHLGHWSPTLRAHVASTLRQLQEDFPQLERDLRARVRRLEDRMEIQAESGDRTAWVKLRADLVAARWELVDLQRQYELIGEVADAAP